MNKGNKLQLNCGSCTHKGLVRENNEDDLLIDKNINLFIVADGLGGHQDGEVASSLAISIIGEFVEENISKENDEIDYYKVFQEAYEKANYDILKRGYELQQRYRMGTTATSALILEDRYIICHTGDSRAYLIRDEKLYRLTKDHTKFQEMIESGRTSDDSVIDKDYYGRVLTYCLGSEEKLKVDLYRGSLFTNDYLLLCSDGLSDYVEDEFIYNQFTKGKEPEDICKDLVSLALAAGGPDNITAVVIKIE